MRPEYQSGYGMLRDDEHELLSGVVGSHAYGLADENSDVDRLGVFAADTEKILGLHRPRESAVRNNPDVTFHEAGKYVRLVLKCNPTATELLWLPRSLGSYEAISDFGEELISIRRSFLSAKYVRDVYFGYAAQQFRRLEARGDGSFSADTRKRTAKHARRLLRLLDQGLQLYRDGHLVIRVDDPGVYHDFGRLVAAGDLELAKVRLSQAESLFDAATSPLPQLPDERPAEDWLLRVRRFYW